MHNRIILVLVLLVFSKICISQSGNVVYVFDADTKIPLQDVSIQVDDKLLFTDENGFSNFFNSKLKSDSIFFEKAGYSKKGLSTKSFQYPVSIFLNKRITSLTAINITSGNSRNIFKTISDLDIHLRPVNNSQEVLRMVPGLFIGQHAGGGKAEQLFLRGFDIDHGTDISISADGMPVNMVSHAHGQEYADLHFIIPELIEKIDFNKGPYFADKGNFTTAGYVDFRTKNFLSDDFVKVEGGQFNTFRAIVGINLLKKVEKIKSRSFYIAGEGSFTQGYFDNPQHFQRFNGIIKYHGKISPSSVATFSLTAFNSRWNASGQIPDRAVAGGLTGFYGAIDNTEGGNTSRYNVNAEIQSNVSNGIVFRQQLYYSRYHFNLFSNFTFFKGDSINGDQIRQREYRNIFGYNGSYRKINTKSTIKMESNAGLQIRYDDINDIALDHTKNRTSIINTKKSGDIHELNIAGYWSQRFSFSNQLNITSALRADYFQNKYADKLNYSTLQSDQFVISPKIQFNYQINRNVQLYLYSGKGFHNNDTRVAVLQNGKKVVPPAYGADIGTIIKPGKKLLIQTAFWYLWLQQEFVYVGDEGIVEAGGKSRRMGFDFSLRYELLNNLFADADVSIANPRATGVNRNESFLPLAPRFTSVGGLTYKKIAGWNGSLRYRYMANRPANETNTVIAKGYFVTDASLNFTQKKWEAGVAIQNLFNVKWKETQFDTESQLQDENTPVSEIHFTPGTPLFARLSFTLFF